MDVSEIRCRGCGRFLPCDPSAAAEDREPCPDCRSTSRHTLLIHVEEIVPVRESVRLEGWTPGERKAFMEQLVGDDLQRSTGRRMHKERLIDRRNDRYREVIVDPETGNEIHRCEEPLSAHRGHGSAKFKKS
jgi:hypothetical protein